MHNSCIGAGSCNKIHQFSIGAGIFNYQSNILNEHRISIGAHKNLTPVETGVATKTNCL
jgi:hypothetical protein